MSCKKPACPEGQAGWHGYRRVGRLVDEEHLAIFRERPDAVVDEQFQLVGAGAHRAHRRDDLISEVGGVLQQVPFFLFSRIVGLGEGVERRFQRADR